MRLSPSRGIEEPLRSFRLRQARSAALWLVALGAPLAAMVVGGIRVQGSSTQGLVLFLYFALSIGTGMASLAAAWFALAAWWAGVAVPTATNVRLVLGAFLFLPISCGALYFFARGLVSLEAPLLLVRRGPPFVSWSSNPISFVVNMGILGGLAIGLPVLLFRRYRRGAT
jgi:hypothetical protein